jgi:hypothetical protein
MIHGRFDACWQHSCWPFATTVTTGNQSELLLVTAKAVTTRCLEDCRQANGFWHVLCKVFSQTQSKLGLLRVLQTARQGEKIMQISGASSAAMPTQAMPSNMGQNASSQSQSAVNTNTSGNGSTPLSDSIETGKALGAALMMSVLFGKDGNDEENKESDTMAMMMMAAGAMGGACGNSYDASGQVQQGSSVGQSLNVTA